MGCAYSKAKVKPLPIDIIKELQIKIPINFNKNSLISSEIVSKYIKLQKLKN
jgi:hypothetical protein